MSNPRMGELVSCAFRESRAQLHEDLLLLPTLLKAAWTKSSPGVFVEIGAFDGKTYSNTLMLEECFGWRGVLIEANPRNFAMLNASGRRAHLVNSAVCGDGARNTVRFSLDGNETAGELDRLTKRRQARRRHNSVDVPCKPMSVILSDYGLTGADFPSLDVEGAEDKVLSTVSPDAFQLIMVETNSRSTLKIAKLMRAASMQQASNVTVPFSDIWLRPGVEELPVPGVRISPRITQAGPKPFITRVAAEMMMDVALAGYG